MKTTEALESDHADRMKELDGLYTAVRQVVTVIKEEWDKERIASLTQREELCVKNRLLEEKLSSMQTERYELLRRAQRQTDGPQYAVVADDAITRYLAERLELLRLKDDLTSKLEAAYVREASKADRIYELCKTCELLEQEVKRITHLYEDAQKAHAATVGRISADRDRVLTDLRSRDASCADYRWGCGEFQKEIDRLSSERRLMLTDARLANSACNTLLEEKSAAFDRVTKELLAVKATLEAVRSERDHLSIDHGKQRDRIDGLTYELSQVREARDNAIKLAQGLRADLDAGKTPRDLEHDSLLIKVNQLTTQRDRLAAENDKLRTEHGFPKRDVLISTNVALRAESERLGFLVHRARLDLDKVERQLAEAQDQLETLDRDHPAETVRK